MDHFYRDTVGPYWPPERSWIESGYAGLKLPGEELPAPPFTMVTQWTREHVVGYLRSWSATQGYIKDQGVDPTLALDQELARVWPRSDTARRLVWPLKLRVGRSSPGRDPVFRETATALGQTLAKRGITMVFGGGKVGLMGACADAALSCGGKVIGVIPEALKLKEVAHENLTEMRVVKSMHERKALMAELSDGFIAPEYSFAVILAMCIAAIAGCTLLIRSGYKLVN